ncbi:hypothetical protein MVEN_01283900 [Mycena venus]|uniref:F-box domain-containing protein n=1 Tax=Mycena venus TaxID=2733690 RepID=A0A8H6Y0R1_9AGAR|nr:hypothetical protein MVEN_01283900 [Mycena venus]
MTNDRRSARKRSTPTPSLTDLPTELLLQIISYDTSLNFLTALERRESEDSDRRWARRQVLRALSQSCSTLRAVFLPALWERVDISKPNFRQRDLTGEVASRIFAYIKFVQVSMQVWSMKEMKPILHLVKFLRSLPKLADLRIRSVNWEVDKLLVSAFADVSLPTVASLAVADALHPIFHAFPNVTTLACPLILAGSDALRSAIAHFRRLSTLVGLRMYKVWPHFKFDTDSISECARHFPRLRALSITTPLPREPQLQTGLGFLRAFTQLAELTFFHRSLDRHTLPLDVLVAQGTEILKASRSPDAKVFRIWNGISTEGWSLFYEKQC